MARRLSLDAGEEPLPCGCDLTINGEHYCGRRKTQRSNKITIRKASSSGTFPIVHPNDDEPQAKRLRQTAASPKRRSSAFLTPTGLQQRVRLKGFPADVFHPEPFNAYPIPAVGCVHRMVEYFVHVWIPQHGRGFSIEGHENPYRSLMFPYALQNAVLFEATVALSRVAWLLNQGLPVSEDRAFAFHRNNSIAALQERLQSVDKSADDTTLLTMAALTTINYILGQHNSAESHLRLMRHIVNARGGMKQTSAWERFLTAVVYAYEVLWGFVLQDQEAERQLPSPSFSSSPSPMKNELPIYESHPFSSEFCVSLSKIPKSFSDIAIAGNLSVQIVRLISDIPTTDTSNSEQRITSQPTFAPDLAKILSDLLRISAMHTTKIEHLVCQGLIAYCLPLHYGQQLPEGVTRVLESARDAFTRHKSGTEAPYTNLIIWLSFAIGGALSMTADSTLHENSPLEEVLSKNKNLREWTNVEKIIREYFWHDRLVPQWYGVWHTAIHRRLSQPPHAYRTLSLASSERSWRSERPLSKP